MKAPKAILLPSIFALAHVEGKEAGEKVTPVPMHISGYEPIADGVCGFANVLISGRGSVATYAKSIGFRSAYGGGFTLYIPYFNQSMARKEAYAAAYAEVLNRYGIIASWSSRMD